ncbi:uncharacterized protein V6R79_004711 [Siganus canaliculatus]
MVTAFALLLTGCLLRGSVSREFRVSMPQTLQGLAGSCVTIPCGFDIESQFDERLKATCQGVWKSNDTAVFYSSSPHSSQIRGVFHGNLRRKDCTTTLGPLQLQHGGQYTFRLECNNELRHEFRKQVLNIQVEEEPPAPTLSPSSLQATEGTTVSLRCSAPAPCQSHPPSLSWSPGLGEGRETLQTNPDKSGSQTSEVNFTVSAMHHGQKVSCTAVYPRQDGGDVSVHAQLTAEVFHSPTDTRVWVRPAGPVSADSIMNLTCSSSAHPAVSAFTWHRVHGDPETTIASGPVLYIQASEFKSPIFCKAQNRLGEGRSGPVHADVQRLLTFTVFCATLGALLAVACVLLVVIGCVSSFRLNVTTP